MYGPLILMLNRVQASLCFLHGLQHKLHIPPVTLTLRGELHPARCTMQQYHTELFLKGGDLLADGGLLDPGQAGGSGKGAGFGDAQKSGNSVELIIHFVILLINAIGFGGYIRKK